MNMKKLSILSLIALIAFSVTFSSCKNTKNQENTISISGAFALYPMTVKWAEEYKKLHPDISIDISAGGAGKGMTDVLSDLVDLAMFSRHVSNDEIAKGAYPIAVSRDAVLPIFSLSNSDANLITKHGSSQENFVKLFITKEITKWNQFIPETKNEDINIFTRSDACGAGEMWAAYLGKHQEDLVGVGVFGDPGIADAVKADKNSIGYANVIYVYDMHTRQPYEGIGVIPLDLNANGTIDTEENFYGSLDSVMSAIAENRFPAPPARDLYLISKGKPQKKAVVDFINWILTEGQKFVGEAGYVNLNSEQIKKEQEKL